MSSNASFVELRNVTFGYGDRVILRDLSLQVPRGKVTALMGASGGGKTTVLRLIGGQNRAQKGEVLFDGQDVTQMDTQQLYAARRRMGMLFQFGALFTDMSVLDNVAFPLREHTDLPEALIRDIVLMKLHAVGLRGARKLMPSEIGSRPAKGSSYMMSSGSNAIARASATRRAIPPETWEGIRSRAPRRPTACSFMSTMSRISSSGRSVCSRSGNATLSNTFISVNRAPNWNSMPSRRRRR